MALRKLILINLVFIALAAAPVKVFAQEEPPKNEHFEKKKKEREKEAEKAEKEGKKRHQKIQDKETRKRMKKNKKKAERLQKGKNPLTIWQRIFNKG